MYSIRPTNQKQIWLYNHRVPMMQGFVALIDVLGFKGIWERNDSDSLLQRMHEMETALKKSVESRKRRLTESDDIVQIHVAFLSDTIAIGAGYRSAEPIDLLSDEHRELAFSIVSSLSRIVVHSWAKDSPHLAVRGCVSAGEYAMKGALRILAKADTIGGNKRTLLALQSGHSWRK